jgi:hypothetical protein
MHDEGSCEICVVANVLHMYGVIDQPDLRWLDQQLGRKLGQPLDGGVATDFLLQMGFHIHRIAEKRFDEYRFLREGLAYLREFLGKSWTTSHSRFWTQAMVAQRQRSVMKSVEIRKEFQNRVTFQIGKNPTVEDIQQQLAQGRVVAATWGKEAIAHAVLVCGYGEQDGRPYLTTFYPADRSSFLVSSPNIFPKEGWNPLAGTVSYWLPKS